MTAAPWAIPWRFVAFAGLCGLWLAALVVWPAAGLVQAGGRAWFLCWGIQIALSLASWARPLGLPAWYDRPLSIRLSRRTARAMGLAQFARVAAWINPFALERGAPGRLDGVMAAAEVTHAWTCVLVLGASVWAVARGAEALAAWLAVDNLFFNLYPVVLQRHNRERLRALQAGRLAARALREARSVPG